MCASQAKTFTARRTLTHENRCIQQWAKAEATYSEAQANEQQMRFDERML
jgi:hypothetical protein